MAKTEPAESPSEKRRKIEENDRSPQQIQASIEKTRRQISRKVKALQENMETSLDWRERVRQHPVRSVSIAFGIGFFLGLR